MYRDFRRFRPALEFRACVACGRCAEVCPTGSLRVRERVREAFCEVCGLCERLEVERLPPGLAGLVCPVAWVQRRAEWLLPHPWVRVDRCSGCGLCAEACEEGVIEVREGRAVVSGPCRRCGACWELCPRVDCLLPPVVAVREVFLSFREGACVDCGLCIEACPMGWGKGYVRAVGSGRGAEPRARSEARGDRG
ncbi:4Fe-4S binding protein [Methanopyrus sp.]